MPEHQAALHLVRQCLSYCKLAYSSPSRTVPPHLHTNALDEFSRDIRQTVSQISGDFVDDRGWLQAQLGISLGGLGLRCAKTHASAAYIASIMAARCLCEQIDPLFDFSDPHDDLGLTSTGKPRIQMGAGPSQTREYLV